MKRLYSDDGRYTPDASALDDEVFKIMKPIMKRWEEKGYPIREISHVIYGSISMLESEIVLTKGAEIARKRRKERDDMKKRKTK